LGFNQILDLVDFLSIKTSNSGNSQWFKPEFGEVGIPFNVDMGWLISVSSIEEETIGTKP